MLVRQILFLGTFKLYWHDSYHFKGGDYLGMLTLCAGQLAAS